MRNASPSPFCINVLVRLECLVEPLKTRDDALTSVYDAQLDALKTLAMDREVFLRAADMCAQSSLETPDALHLATAIHHRRDVFRTGNARLAGLRVPLEFRVFSG